MGEGSEPAGDQEVEPRVALTEVELASMDAGRLLERCAKQDEASAAVEVVRGLREDPRTRPDATLRLAEHGLERSRCAGRRHFGGARAGAGRAACAGDLQAGLGPGTSERRPRRGVTTPRRRAA